MVGAGQQDPRAHQLEQQPRRGRPAHLDQPARGQVGRPAELDAPEAGRLRDQPLGLVLGHVDEPAGGRIGHRRHDHQVPQSSQQVLREPARVLAGLDHLVDHAEDGGAVAGGERVDDLVEQGVRRVAEEAGRERVGDPGRAGPTHQLVEHRERVPRRAGSGAHHQRQRGRLDGDALLLAQLGEVRRQQPRRDQPERVVVGARPDRREHLLRLGRGEDEAQVRGWLLDQLQQGVEALRRDHVRLVDDVDLVLAGHGREERLLAQVTRVVHAAVGGRVDLDDVDGAGAAAGQVDAAAALAAGVGDRRELAVERPREDPRRGGLAAAARAGEQVGVVDPVVGERGAQRLGDVVLPDDLGERLGPVAAIQREGRLHVCTLTSRSDTSTGRRALGGRAVAPGNDGGHEGGTKGPPAYPTELACPCCLPALGDSARCRHAGGCQESRRGRPGRQSRPAGAGPGWGTGRFLGLRTHGYAPARRIRLVAYGARLESGLG